MEARIRVCVCCGEPFEVWHGEDKDRCGRCQGVRVFALEARTFAMRQQLKREQDRRRENDERD